jgi:N6-L-threonylcarbamoyladenine synthase
MLGLGYPGGEIISRLAQQGNPEKIIFPRAYLNKEGKKGANPRLYDFSFSGLKTSVNRYIQNHPEEYQIHLPDIAAGFQEAVVDVLSDKLIQAAERKECKHIALSGGVAANRRLREKVRQNAETKGIILHIPPVELCGDNAAMIAARGYHSLIRGERTDMDADVYSRVCKVA